VTITPRLEAATVLGDPGLLAQLVTNLVQNAIRHSGSGGSARVTTRSDQAHGKVQLLVESTGSTFTPEEAARLAEPLLRGSGRVAGSEKGHGLGLALVHRIARVHDGSLIIAPRDGGGLVITVELPAVTR
jgi:two-component system sensor histidine kinase VanS